MEGQIAINQNQEQYMAQASFNNLTEQLETVRYKLEQEKTAFEKLQHIPSSEESKAVRNFLQILDSINNNEEQSLVEEADKVREFYNEVFQAGQSYPVKEMEYLDNSINRSLQALLGGSYENMQSIIPVLDAIANCAHINVTILKQHRENIINITLKAEQICNSITQMEEKMLNRQINSVSLIPAQKQKIENEIDKKKEKIQQQQLQLKKITQLTNPKGEEINWKVIVCPQKNCHELFIHCDTYKKIHSSLFSVNNAHQAVYKVMEDFEINLGSSSAIKSIFSLLEASSRQPYMKYIKQISNVSKPYFSQVSNTYIIPICTVTNIYNCQRLQFASGQNFQAKIASEVERFLTLSGSCSDNQMENYHSCYHNYHTKGVINDEATFFNPPKNIHGITNLDIFYQLKQKSPKFYQIFFKKQSALCFKMTLFLLSGNMQIKASNFQKIYENCQSLASAAILYEMINQSFNSNNKSQLNYHETPQKILQNTKSSKKQADSIKQESLKKKFAITEKQEQ